MNKNLLNLGSLACIQASNAFAPLLIFPFLILTLGSSVYADLALAEALSLLVLAVVIFSFEIVGVSRLVAFRETNDRQGISRLFSSVLYIRIILFLAAAPIAVAFYVAAFDKSWLIIALWLLVPLAYIFQSAWFYQGFERNLPLAVFTLLSRLAALALIFLIIDGDRPPYLVPAIFGLTYFIGGVAAFGYAITHHDLRLLKVPLGELIDMATADRDIFFTNVAVSMQRDLNVLILGIVGIPAQSLAAYSIAEKISKSLQAVARPLNQLFFPKAIRAIRFDTVPNRNVARRIARYTLPQIAAVAVLLAALALGLWLVRNHTTLLTPYQEFDEAARYLAIMVPTIVFGIASYMFGSVGLNYLGGQRQFLAIIVVAGVASGLLCFALAHWIGGYAAAICYAGAEVGAAIAVVARFRHKAPIDRRSGP